MSKNENNNLEVIIPVCFFCKEELKGTDIIHNLADTLNTNKIEKQVFVSYEPCEKCKERIEKDYVILIGTTLDAQEDDRPPIATSNNGEDAYPINTIMLPDKIAKELIYSGLVHTKALNELLKRDKAKIVDDTFFATKEDIAEICEEIKNDSDDIDKEATKISEKVKETRILCIDQPDIIRAIDQYISFVKSMDKE